MKREAATLVLVLSAAIVACVDPPLPTESAIPKPLDTKVVTYDITDLGMFGGKTTFALDMSKAGVVIGRYGVGLDQRSFSWSSGAGYTDLGEIEGHPFEVLRSNDKGDLVGWVPTGPTTLRPVVLTAKRGLEYVDDAAHTGIANGINSKGTVAGRRNPLAGGPSNAFVWSRKGGLVVIPPAAGPRSVASHINDHGVVVGSTTNSAVCCSLLDYAFKWTSVDGMTVLPSLGGNAFATAANDKGDIIGQSETRAGGPGESHASSGVPGAIPVHAVLWKADGTLVDLGTLGGTNSVAWSVNDKGEVAGWAENGAGVRRAFRWKNGVMVDLGSLGGPSSTTGSISNKGIVVGQAETPTNELHAVIFTRH